MVAYIFYFLALTAVHFPLLSAETSDNKEVAYLIPYNPGAQSSTYYDYQRGTQYPYAQDPYAQYQDPYTQSPYQPPSYVPRQNRGAYIRSPVNQTYQTYPTTVQQQYYDPNVPYTQNPSYTYPTRPSYQPSNRGIMHYYFGHD